MTLQVVDDFTILLLDKLEYEYTLESNGLIKSEVLSVADINIGQSSVISFVPVSSI